MEIRFDAARSTELLSQVGKYAVGLLAVALLYKIYQVYNARWTRPPGEYDLLCNVTKTEPWRKSTIEYKKNYSSNTHLVEDRVVSVDNKIEQFQIDPNPYLTAAKVRKIGEDRIQVPIERNRSLTCVDKVGIAWFNSADSSLYRTTYDGTPKRYFLGIKPSAMAYDTKEVITATSEGKVQKWIPNEQGDAIMETDATFAFPSLKKPITLLKRFQENDKTYIFLASGTAFELWQQKLDKWEKVISNDPSGYMKLAACTIGEGKLFVAQGRSIHVWAIEEKKGTYNCLATDHITTDMNYYEGRLFAVGNKLTVWDFRRKTQPGRIDQLWDKFLRLF